MLVNPLTAPSRLVRRAILLLAAPALLACGDDRTGPSDPALAGVAITNATDTLGIADTLRLRAEARDSSDAVVDARLDWRSLDATVAAVSGTGLLVGVDSGDARVVVMAQGRTSVADTIFVRVRPLPHAIELSGLADTVYVRARDTVQATVLDGRGLILPTARLQWSSSDTTVLVIDSLGRVTGRETGSAWVRVTAGRARDSVRVAVDYRLVPTPVPFVDFASISFPGAATPPALRQCGMTAAGSAWCSGSVRPAAFAPLAGDLAFRDVQAGQNTTCGLAADDRLYCWGANQYGNFGLGSNMPQSSTAPLLALEGRQFASISMGAHGLVCGVGVADSLAWCWGHNDFGQVGRFPTTGTEYVPAPVPGLPRVKKVSTGFVDACAIAVDGSTWCWGSGFAWATSPEPKQVAAPGVYIDVEASNGTSCGLTPAGAVECFGSATGARQLVADLPPLARLVNVSNETGGCGLTTAGAGYCWFYPTLHAAKRVFATRTLRNITFGTGGIFCGITTDDKLYCS